MVQVQGWVFALFSAKLGVGNNSRLSAGAKGFGTNMNI